MTMDQTTWFGIMLGVVAWAALIGGIAALAAWGLFLSDALTRRPESKGEENAAGSAAAQALPAEEGAKIDEWEADRRDRAA